MALHPYLLIGYRKHNTAFPSSMNYHGRNLLSLHLLAVTQQVSSLPLHPLLQKGLIETSDIIVNSISGISGAGKNASEHLLFCERNESAGVYGLPKHRHLSEIEEQLSQFAQKSIVLSFHPHLGPMNRGICSTISVRAKGGLHS